ncbi:MAG: AAA family ATPase, partial [Limisphaerales bacterium]
MITETQLNEDAATPRWLREVLRFLPVKSQFVLSGNIRDLYQHLIVAETKDADGETVTPAAYVTKSLPCYVGEALRLRGFDYCLQFNTVEGFSVVPLREQSAEEATRFFESSFGLKFDQAGHCKVSFAKLWEIAERLLACETRFVALFMDFASQFAKRITGMDATEHEFFTKAKVFCHSVKAHNKGRKHPYRQFNPIFWICEKENDLPDWLVLDNPRMRSVMVSRPDHIQRRALVTNLSASLDGFEQTEAKRKKELLDQFVEQTEGVTLTDTIAITQLCRRENLGFSEIAEAVRRYKLGVTEDPWKKIDREKIAGAEDTIRKRVKGQTSAVVKALDIIKRAVTGVSGGTGGRPRGVMFLAGPTGTGKTELAKTLTALLFGDERAYIRFDMSEFSAEHADQRLIGAPPGYVGSDMGGELTNAIKERPFSVVLFDEIEKAHPRILDKFLQVLDDGVLTSGRGERVYFSEAVIIFTSNLGIYRKDKEGNRVAHVTPEDPYERVEQKVRSEISNYFKTELNRPEILNRMGENIAVFDFIRPKVGEEIFGKMVDDFT